MIWSFSIIIEIMSICSSVDIFVIIIIVWIRRIGIIMIGFISLRSRRGFTGLRLWMFIVWVFFWHSLVNRVISNGGELGFVLNNLSDRRFNLNNSNRLRLRLSRMPPNTILSFKELTILLIRTQVIGIMNKCTIILDYVTILIHSTIGTFITFITWPCLILTFIHWLSILVGGVVIFLTVWHEILVAAGDFFFFWLLLLFSWFIVTLLDCYGVWL